ncbi:small integral membrane protein 30-like [Conger conger]|uniref:small integral membrane protein 30-like n=1 Tax=Conger conger TaxID=82655 RepID=UPI002A5A3034|nr:small integral membrane protein 30-like [Conger conger]
MASYSQLCGVFAMLWLLLGTFILPVEAFDGGDAAAILLGMAVTVVGFCACLGWYARRTNGQL